MKLLDNAHISLRAVEPTDLDTIFEWENDTKIWQYGSTVAPYSRLQIYEYIKNYSADIFKDSQLRLVVVEKHSGKPVGMVDLFEFSPMHLRAYVGILIRDEFRGKGYGYEAVSSLIEYASNFIGLHQLAVNIPKDNGASLGLFSKLGFSQTGVLKDWLRAGNSYNDVVVMQKIL